MHVITNKRKMPVFFFLFAFCHSWKKKLPSVSCPLQFCSLLASSVFSLRVKKFPQSTHNNVHKMKKKSVVCLVVFRNIMSKKKNGVKYFSTPPR